MSRDNGKNKAKKQKPIQASVLANATILQLHNTQQTAKARLDLAITVLKQQLNVPESWAYQTDSRSFLPPETPAAAPVKPQTESRFQSKDGDRTEA